jgi:hypothetical protein
MRTGAWGRPLLGVLRLLFALSTLLSPAHDEHGCEADHIDRAKDRPLPPMASPDERRTNRQDDDGDDESQPHADVRALAAILNHLPLKVLAVPSLAFNHGQDALGGARQDALIALQDVRVRKGSRELGLLLPLDSYSAGTSAALAALG